MHYYQFNIGDYKSHTSHLTLIEDIAYRRLLDMYYLHEKPLDNSIPAVARLVGMREHEEAVEMVLLEFFECIEEGGWIHKRADKEIAAYKGFIESGKRGAAIRWAKGDDSHPITPPNATPIENNNHKPITNNHKPILKPLSDYSDEFEEVWSLYPKRPGANKKDSYKAWSARLKNGVLSETIKAGVMRYAHYCKSTCINSQFIKQPATFFGPAEHFLNDWAVPAGNSTKQDSLKHTGDFLTGRYRDEHKITIDMD